MTDDILIPGNDETGLLGKYVIATQGGPAYVRRAKHVEEAFDGLLARCQDRRAFAAAGVADKLNLLRSCPALPLRLGGLLAGAADLTAFRQLDALFPTAPAAVPLPERKLARALHDLAAAVDRFNAAWASFLNGLDLKPVNELRADYNKYYLLEKECAVRSPRLARQGYRPLPPLTVEELFARFPLLPRPRFAGG